jgi:acetyl-CoA synthetase
MPKVVRHDFAYPLGHILTAKYWQCVEDGGLHFTIADTGWAKAAWGKIYGQWICGAAVFVYDYDKFVPTQMLGLIASHGVTAFCAPPTIYRIGPFEVESALIEHPAVLECAVTGIPDADRGADVKATVVLAKGYAPGPDLATELPKTISGKIRRVEIRKKDAE